MATSRPRPYPVEEEPEFGADRAPPAAAPRGALAAGKASHLITATVAFFCVRFVSLPMCGHLTRALEAMWPAALRPYLDPAQDDTAVLMGCSALSAYLVVAVGLCSLLDCHPEAHRYKTQGHRSIFTWDQWTRAVAVGLSNILLFSWFATIPAWQLQRRGGGSGAWDTPLSLPNELACFAVHVVTIDVWFYVTHRALHLPLLYKWIHKFHHAFKAPAAIACVYANPIEFCVGNVGGVVLGPALTRCHPYAAAYWLAFALTSTSLAHSGYRAFGAEEHDAHHEHFSWNFGVGILMDRALGTCLPEGLRARGGEKIMKRS